MPKTSSDAGEDAPPTAGPARSGEPADALDQQTTTRADVIADVCEDGQPSTAESDDADVPLPGSDGTDSVGEDDDGGHVGDEYDLDEDWAPQEPDVPHRHLLLPRITVTWPRCVAPSLETLPAARLDGPMAQLRQLADALTDAVAVAGPGNLAVDGVRWSAEYGWQLMLTPAYGTDGSLRSAQAPFDEGALAAAWRRDQQAVAAALVTSAVGRAPEDVRDARRLVDMAAGELPPGLDAVVNLLLAGGTRTSDTGGLRRLAEALDRQAERSLSARCYLESGVGSRKASGRPSSDNEDAAAADVRPDGTTRLAVFDGVTGDGLGSGGLAANTARAAVVTGWAGGIDDPVDLLDAADGAVVETTDGCATAVVVTIDTAGTARLASLGDSSAWLVRPSQAKGFHAWRLTPAHTVYAERLRDSPHTHGGYSDVTRYLGGAADRPFTARFAVHPGDLLVLATDGATSEQPNEWFGEVLRDLVHARTADGGPIGGGVAADLVIRSERLGGWDNATALVTEFDETDPR